MNLEQAMNKYGSELVNALKNALMMDYMYAPGFMKDAYSNGRNRQYSGSAPKRHSGSLIDSISYTYDVSNEELLIFMNDYWQYVNDGRQPGKYIPVTNSLKQWAKDKLGDEGAAYAISRNAYKFGIAPTKFYDTALDNMNFGENIPVELEDGLEMMMNDYIEKTFIEPIFKEIEEI